ncbi:hypothetical protein Acy02nite_00830 [Actinoplanes cyaneus]|uniref:Uncharacterized protein n=1 Tax=Actinoplanes cyaneus TaxID=52696 RepID=A0A919IB22_9ACTN|nr:hypothetical protein [Actinoplanes cyaneus]GID62202.1 hypothetical protein Acy02nite_00830 [Actinoplanes cyaneus]
MRNPVLRGRTRALLAAVTALVVAGGIAGRSYLQWLSIPYEPLPATGAPGPAVCPPTWPGNQVTRSVRGPLVADDPRLALLCHYQTILGEPWPLAATSTATANAPKAARYLNDLPEEDSTVCPLWQPAVEYAVVFEYADRQPMTVTLGCMMSRGNVTRVETDSQEIADFWNVTYNQLPR